MTRIGRQFQSEARYLIHSRFLVVLVAVLALGVTVAFTGSLSAAKSANANFVEEVSTYEKNGVTLEEALKTPVKVTTSGDKQTIDNPLKYDYLQVGKAVKAVQGTTMIGTALDLVTFIVAPMLFLLIGALSANLDRASGTAAFRAARERWVWVTVGKMITLVALSLFSVATITVLALIAGWAGSSSVSRLTRDIPYQLTYPTSSSSMASKLLVTAFVCVFFGVVGYAIGFITKSTSWPLVLAAAVLFLLPFVSVWDPRNLLAVVGSHVYDFWGQFVLRPPLPVSEPTALTALFGYLTAAALVVVVGAKAVRLR